MAHIKIHLVDDWLAEKSHNFHTYTHRSRRDNLKLRTESILAALSTLSTGLVTRVESISIRCGLAQMHPKHFTYETSRLVSAATLQAL